MKKSLVALFTVLIVADALACSSSKPEQFDAFITAFRADRNFEVRRTIYPYLVRNHSEERSWDVDVPTGKDQRTASLDTIAKTGHSEFANPEVEGDRASLRMFVPNTGYSQTFNFVRSRGCWYFNALDVLDF